MRSTPVWHIELPPLMATAVWQLLPAAALAKSLPETKTMTGWSRLLMAPSQLVSYIRPTTGVAQMSVYWGLALATGPHCQSTTALSVVLTGGWYSQSGTQPASGPGAPASPGQMGGRGTHLPLRGRGGVRPPP